MFLGAGYAGLALAPGPGYAVPCLMALGAGLYMLHNTLQLHATQMAPESRGAAVALFALCLFTGQSAGVWLASQAVDAIGTLAGIRHCRRGIAVAGARIPPAVGQISELNNS